MSVSRNPTALSRIIVVLSCLTLPLWGCGGGDRDDDGGATDQHGGGTDAWIGDGASTGDGALEHDATVPADATACMPGLTRCNGTCVNLQSDAQHCGACNNACPGTHSCSAGSCQPLPTDCRTGGGCPAQYYCDLNDGACKPGCASDDQCPQPGTCDIANHACQCSPGFHNCGGSCVTNSSVDHCGASCSPCPSTPNGTPACNGQSCGVLCTSGYHACSGQCVSNSSVANCGNLCAPCPTDPFGTPTCDGQSCGLDCQSGYHDCGGSCVSSDSPDHCGTSCTPCPTPDHATATCDGQSCGMSCDFGYHDCNEDPTDGCESSASVTCYQDQDDDGYGVSSPTQTFFCSCPTGWTDSYYPADCEDTNADVHPEQSSYFTIPYNGSSFDYNCDGDETHPYYSLVTSSCHTYTSSSCPKKGFTGGSIPECGQSGNYVVCAKGLNSYDPCWLYTSETKTMECH